MDKQKEKTVCVVDHGHFVDFAVWLQKHFKRVLYVTPWQCSLPKSNDCMIGLGLVDKIENIWDHIDEIDLFIFPDIYHGPTQVYLESIGKQVWGSREGENLEIWRAEAKKFMADLGITIGPYEIVKGSEALRSRLKKTKDKFIKVSKTRGDFETFQHNEWGLTEPWLDELEYRLGAKKKIMEFIIEDAIDPAYEIGYDGYCVDGKFADPGIIGVEIKDHAYLGRVSPKLPTPASDANNRLSATFKKVHYRNFFCSEIRVKNSKGYMLDPCCRVPTPPGDIYPHWIENLAEIIWEGSAGRYVAPEYGSRWGAELLLLGEWSNDKWTAVQIPDEFKDHVKLRGRVKTEGKDYVIPGLGVGGVVAIGNSADEAIDQCERIAAEIKGLEITYEKDALQRAKDEFAKIEFPKEETVQERRPAPDKESLASLLQPKSLAEVLR